MSDEALKPCPVPWCGGLAEIKGDDEIYFTEPPTAHIICIDCGFETPTFDTHAEAITAWNTRAGDRDISDLREALKQIARYDVGLQALIEDGVDTPENRAKYYEGRVEYRRSIARAALQETER